MTRPKFATASIAAVVVLGAVVPLIVASAGPAVANHAGDDTVRTYHAVQDDRCVTLTPLGDGQENVTEFYDYRPTYSDNYSSQGTEHLQESQVSQLFVYHGVDGVSLVLLHDSLEWDDEGGAVSMEVRNLPEDGRWVVEDDNYGNDTDDNFVHDGTRSEIDWMWSPGRTDGAVFQGLDALDSGDRIRIDPAFSEQSYAYQDRSPQWPYASDNLTWHARNGEGDLVSLAEDQRVSLGPGACEPTPPTASLTADPASSSVNESVTLDASQSFDEGDLVAYHWDVDRDGDTDVTTTSDRTLNHSYAEPGTYTAAVTVVDDDGENDTATTTVTVTDGTPPVARASVNRTSVETGDPIAFDGSDSTDNVNVTDARWEFDDGAVAENETATHAYDEPGIYDATLTVSDAAGNVNETTVTVTVADDDPTAALDAPETAAPGTDVTLDAGNSSDPDGIDEYRWDLDGDGSPDRTTTGPTTVWSETSSGTHNVGVTVVDGEGNTNGTTATIEVQDTTPTAAMSADATTVEAGTSVSFDGSASTNATTYEWSFGDGATATGETTTHTFDDEGTYEVTLTVSDDDGDSDATTTTITVEAREADDGGDDGSSGGDTGGGSGGGGGGSSGGSSSGGSTGGAPSSGLSSSDDSADASVERVSEGVYELRIEDPSSGEPVSAAVPGVDNETTELRAVQVVPSTDADWLNVTLVSATDVDAPNGTDAGLIELAVQGDPAVERVTYQFAAPRDEVGEPDGDVRAFADGGDGWTRVEHTVVADGSVMVVNATTDTPDPVVLAAVRPDLSVASIEPVGTPTVGESATIEVELTNDGHAAVNRSISLTVDGEEVETRSVEVPAKDERTVSFRTTFDSVGDRDVSVAGTTQTVPVASPGANVSLTDVSLVRSEVSPGEAVTVEATFENTGDATGTAVANFTVVDAVVDVERATVEPGEEVTLRFEESIDAPGDYAVGVNDERRTVTVGQAATSANESAGTPADTGSNEENRNSRLFVAGFGVLVILAAALSRVLS